MMSDHEQPLDFDPDPVRRAFDAMMADPVTDAAAVEQPPECECKCDGAEPHADRRCHKRATTLVALHRWGWCDEDPRMAIPPLADPAACDDRGNMTSLMCDKCADHAVAVAKAKIRLLMQDPDTYGAHPECPTCHKHTIRWQDILETHPMKEWPTP